MTILVKKGQLTSLFNFRVPEGELSRFRANNILNVSDYHQLVTNTSDANFELIGSNCFRSIIDCILLIRS